MVEFSSVNAASKEIAAAEARRIAASNAALAQESADLRYFKHQQAQGVDAALRESVLAQYGAGPAQREATTPSPDALAAMRKSPSTNYSAAPGATGATGAPIASTTPGVSAGTNRSYNPLAEYLAGTPGGGTTAAALLQADDTRFRAEDATAQTRKYTVQDKALETSNAAAKARQAHSYKLKELAERLRLEGEKEEEIAETVAGLAAYDSGDYAKIMAFHAQYGGQPTPFAKDQRAAKVFADGMLEAYAMGYRREDQLQEYAIDYMNRNGVAPQQAQATSAAEAPAAFPAVPPAAPKAATPVNQQKMRQDAMATAMEIMGIDPNAVDATPVDQQKLYAVAEEQYQYALKGTIPPAPPPTVAPAPPPDESFDWSSIVPDFVLNLFSGDDTATAAPAATPAATPSPGDIVNGFEFLGGDTRDRNNWKPVTTGAGK